MNSTNSIAQQATFAGLFLIYCRVSQDPKARMASTGQQEAEGRAEARELGVPEAQIVVLTDQAVSASEYAKGKVRTAWPEVMALLDGGTVTHLYTWENSRTERTLDGHVVLRKALRGKSVLWHYSGNVYDMANGRDRKTAANDAVDAEYESYQTSQRVKRDIRHHAIAGMPHGRRPFGYERVYSKENGTLEGQQPHPTEAPVVIEAAHRFAAGESAGAILADFNERDLPRPGKAAQWNRDTLKTILTSPTQNGKRSHKGLITDGQWQANIDDATFSAVAVRYADPSRKSHRDNKVSHLLSGIARCGKCLAYVEACKSYKGKTDYRCSVTPHLSRDAKGMDAQISDLMVELLETADPMALAPAEDTNPYADQEAKLKAKLAAAFDSYDNDGLSVEAYVKVEQSVSAKLADLRRQQVKAVPLPEAVIELFGPGALERWKALDLMTQRTAIRRLLSVTVLPAPVGLNRYDNDLLDVVPLAL